MIAVALSREQWSLVLAALAGLEVQLRQVAGPAADGSVPRTMSAVRLLGDLSWVTRAVRVELERQ